MLEYTKQILESQLQASLAMLGECILRCPANHWQGKVVKYEFWHVAYHTLYCTDVYLAKSWEAFEPSEFLPAGRQEIELEFPTRVMTAAELSAYLEFIRGQVSQAMARETIDSLQSPPDFPWLGATTRGELYLYSIRHVAHHTGQLGAYLRRIGVDTDWIKRA